MIAWRDMWLESRELFECYGSAQYCAHALVVDSECSETVSCLESRCSAAQGSRHFCLRLTR